MIPILGNTINYQDYTALPVDVHVVGWFGHPGHINMGFNSGDESVIDSDILLMRYRGIKGVNFDWYGPESNTARTALTWLNACERNDLSFSICIDHGAIDNKGLTGSKADAEYIRCINFLCDAFFTSVAYLKDSTGNPVVSLFGEGVGSTPANYATQTMAGKALTLVYEGSSGFSKLPNSGAFGWVNPTTPLNNINIPSIQTFNAAALANPTRFAWYPVYKGFDDSMASWGKGRYMSTRLGQTTLDTLALVPKAKTGRVLIATWDDFEEGTATRYAQG